MSAPIPGNLDLPFLIEVIAEYLVHLVDVADYLVELIECSQRVPRNYGGDESVPSN